jgi:uncharacterized protein YdcH (DUF465 family)
MYDKPHHIRERFPEKRDRIDRLMVEDPEFLALCEDYDACVNALHYWAESREPEAKPRVHEYRNLVRELEAEVVKALTALKP